ncbi:MAG: amidase [Ectothiorhodospiraceae bacterium]|nr:amidase [Ectothiorhodospiraceae bacterium]
MAAVNELPASEAVRALQRGKLTSEALVRACVERIEAREPDVEAWAHFDAGAAIAEARARDRAGRPGPLHGLPVGFKDIIDTADMPTAYGSEIYPGHRPVGDAACVALVRAAGGVVMGKTVTTEFAFVNPGKTRNPLNREHTPGGSSSGSAAAVADHMVALAFGTQTGGSVIRPGSFCGVVAYKPTFGQLSYTGVKVLAASLDTLGTYGRRVADHALLRAALLGAPATVALVDGPPRIGLCRTPWWDRADASSQAAVEAAGRALAAAGARVTDVDLPRELAGLTEANQDIMVFEGRRSLAWEFAHREKKLSPRLREVLARALDMPFAHYAGAVALARSCRQRFESEVMSDLDALLVPSAVGEAPVGFQTTGDALFNRAWTTIGAPCITLPGHTGPKGLPIGVQLVGRPGADERLLSVAEWAETRIV